MQVQSELIQQKALRLVINDRISIEVMPPLWNPGYLNSTKMTELGDFVTGYSPSKLPSIVLGTGYIPI